MRSYSDTGDDCIAIKSGRNNDGRRWNLPTEKMIVRNCQMKNGHRIKTNNGVIFRNNNDWKISARSY